MNALPGLAGAGFGARGAQGLACCALRAACLSVCPGSDLTGRPVQAPSPCPPPEGEKNPASVFHVLPCVGF